MTILVLKTGASGMIAYRLQAKDGQWQWLQTSSRLVYKNSKPDFVISTHRPLMYVPDFAKIFQIMLTILFIQGRRR